jgi:Xaa-Pro aminopeptidase
MKAYRVCSLLLLLVAASWHTTFASPPAARLFGITLEEYARRRAALRASAPDVLFLLRGPSESGDIERTRFRTDNNLLYLTGVEAPGAYLALLPEGDPRGLKEILFLPARGPFSQWVDPIPAPGPLTERATGIQCVRNVKDLWEVLTPSIHCAKAVYFVGPAGERAKYTPNAATEEHIRRIRPDIAISRKGLEKVHALRRHKSPAEVANIRTAIAITGEAITAVARALRPGATELEIEGNILAAFRKRGAVREGFPCIVASGPNATILHHFSTTRRMKAGEMLIVDIGAEYNYYSADITRTLPVGGKFTPRQKALYRLVLETQRACEKFVRPGITTLSELDRYARTFLRQSSLRAKQIDGTEQTMDAFFVHSVGHWLGMDVHDVSGGSEVLEPGVVFTIEPGVYIESEDIGIRIEDAYLVTKTGLIKLSAKIPSTPEQIEKMMRRSR